MRRANGILNGKQYGVLKKFKHAIMNNDKQTFDKQEAPEKNTDAAFVQVGADGKPVTPENAPNQQPSENSHPKEGTLADR
jgi:hypothetical protein